MPSPVPESSAPLKRKRTPSDEGRDRDRASHSHPAVTPVPSNSNGINYMVKAKSERLRLIEGDNSSFSDVLDMIDDYEGVLQRHESLAANLGAKLVGPLLLKSFEKLFDGPIKTVPGTFAYSEPPVTWLDVVSFAKATPSEFYLSDKENLPGHKLCRFWIKGGQVEISEDDHRLIMSGAPERMIPTQAIPEDESAELGTLNILESRLAMLIKKADAVASKARQLNYHLKGRKSAVLSRRPEPSAETERTFSPQPFSAINASARSPVPTQNGVDARIQQQLLEQFSSYDHHRRASVHTSHKSSKSRPSNAGADFTAFNNGDTIDRRQSTSHPPSDDGIESHYRVIMAGKIEKLNRGDPIYPPCDRCRRLKFECTKHLTACQACTKKHAKCSWRDIREGELDYVGVVQGAQPLVVDSGTEREKSNGYESQVSPGKATSGEGGRMPQGKSGETLAEAVERGEQRDVHNSLASIASAAAAASSASTVH